MPFRSRVCLASLFFIFFCHVNASRAVESQSPLEHSGQCIVAVSDSWSATNGALSWFEREHDSWRKVGGPVPVVLGRAGLAWGRSEMSGGYPRGPIKREGDDKAPAGVFKLGEAFGYASQPGPINLPYVALTKGMVAVDDSHSRYYNQLVDKTKIGRPDWRSAENMILSDNRYKWGIVVRHNVPPMPGAGSNIFLHCWKDRSTLTSGCTAMAEENMVKLLRWLNPRQEPRLVQLPRGPYGELRRIWKLPDAP